MNIDNSGQGDLIKNNLSSWNFDNDVPPNFDKHVSRSVPNYEDGHKLINIYCDFFVNLPSKRAYDIGSSTGSLIEKIQSRHIEKNIEYFGIEPVQKMIDVANKRIYKDKGSIQFLNDSILNIDLLSSSIIISYYTLQFISPGVRQEVFNKTRKDVIDLCSKYPIYDEAF